MWTALDVDTMLDYEAEAAKLNAAIEPGAAAAKAAGEVEAANAATEDSAGDADTAGASAAEAGSLRPAGCPGGHALLRYVSFPPGANRCDLCNRVFAPPAKFRGCRACEYNLCVPCFGAASEAKTSAALLFDELLRLVASSGRPLSLGLVRSREEDALAPPTSRYEGVSWNPETFMWRATIRVPENELDGAGAAALGAPATPAGAGAEGAEKEEEEKVGKAPKLNKDGKPRKKYSRRVEHELGEFHNEFEAARAYDKFACTHRGRQRWVLNFPDSEDARKWGCERDMAVARGKASLLGAAQAAGANSQAGGDGGAADGLAAGLTAEQAAELASGKHPTPRFVGLRWQARRWRVEYTLNGKSEFGGSFEPGEEEAAARAYDAFVAPLGRPVNFPLAPGQPRAVKEMPRQPKAGRGGKSSKYAGVSWDRARRQWRAHVTLCDAPGGQQADAPLLASTSGAFESEGELDGLPPAAPSSLTLGHFKSEEDAAAKYDEVARQLGRPTNLPTDGTDSANGAVEDRKRNGHAGGKADSSTGAKPGGEYGRKPHSAYVGVTWQADEGKWAAKAKVDGESLTFGLFDDEEMAARIYDAHMAPLGKAVNFPSNPGQVQAHKERYNRAQSSRFVGVNWCTRSGRWRANITSLAVPGEGEGPGGEGGGKPTNKTLGYFDEEEEAARVYDEAALEHGRPVNFPAPGQMQAVKSNRGRKRKLPLSGALPAHTSGGDITALFGNADPDGGGQGLRLLAELGGYGVDGGREGGAYEA